MTRTPLPHHLYQANGIPVSTGGPEGCAHCPLPIGHPVHTLPSTSDDTRAFEARKTGDR